MNKVSVIVPIYNRSNFLQRCVESLLNQTYKNIEIILVDDGSTDTSGKKCDEFAKNYDRIKVIHHDVNCGVSIARNHGIEESDGYYLMFVDSDDYLSEVYIEELVSAAESEDAQLVIGGFTYVSNGEYTESPPPKLCFNNKAEFVKEFGRLYEKHYIRSASNKLFFRVLISTHFEPSISLGEDFIFVLEYLKNIDRIKVVDNSGYYYVSEGQASLTKAFRKDSFSVAEMLYVKANEYVAGVENKYAVQSIAKMFMDEVSKYIKDVSINLDATESTKLLENVANSNNFRIARRNSSRLGKRQRVVLYLIEKRIIKPAQKLALIKFR